MRHIHDLQASAGPFRAGLEVFSFPRVTSSTAIPSGATWKLSMPRPSLPQASLPAPRTPCFKKSFLLLAALFATPAPATDGHPVAAAAEPGRTEHVMLATTLGTITLELYPDAAPLTVDNFLRYVDAGKFNDATFYRSVRLDNQRADEIPIEVVQGGIFGRAFHADLALPGTYPAIPHEPTSQTGITHQNGTISMARGEPGTATSEFFISLGENPPLDAGGQRNPDGLGFAAFGRVTEGMEIVRQIHGASTARLQDAALGPMQGQVLDEQVRICHAMRGTAAPPLDNQPAC